MILLAMGKEDTVAEQQPEPAGELVLETIEVIGPKLVDCDGQNEANRAAWWRLGGQARRGYQAKREHGSKAHRMTAPLGFRSGMT